MHASTLLRPVNSSSAGPRVAEKLRVLVELIDAVCSQVVDLETLAAARGVKNDDIDDIGKQVAKVRAAVELVAKAVEAGDGGAAHQELHRLNNHLTGIVSLAGLCRDETTVAELIAPLAMLDATARRAAVAGRELASSTPTS